MWLIEEKAIIFRNLVWFNPIIPPISEEKIIVVEINNEIFKLNIKRIIGAIFCQVKRINLFIQFKPSKTSGNQKWKGAAPIFVSSAEFIIIEDVHLIDWGNSFRFNLTIIENNSTLEARAWVIKYLSAASEGKRFFESLNRGINERRLISNPIHILIQE